MSHTENEKQADCMSARWDPQIVGIWVRLRVPFESYQLESTTRRETFVKTAGEVPFLVACWALCLQQLASESDVRLNFCRYWRACCTKD